MDAEFQSSLRVAEAERKCAALFDAIGDSRNNPITRSDEAGSAELTAMQEQVARLAGIEQKVY